MPVDVDVDPPKSPGVVVGSKQPLTKGIPETVSLMGIFAAPVGQLIVVQTFSSQTRRIGTRKEVADVYENAEHSVSLAHRAQQSSTLSTSGTCLDLSAK
jgi:hypothetical protein